MSQGEPVLHAHPAERAEITDIARDDDELARRGDRCDLCVPVRGRDALPAQPRPLGPHPLGGGTIERQHLDSAFDKTLAIGLELAPALGSRKNSDPRGELLPRGSAGGPVELPRHEAREHPPVWLDLRGLAKRVRINEEDHERGRSRGARSGRSGMRAFPRARQPPTSWSLNSTPP